MPCPTIAVHDGVLGSSTPVARGQSLTLTATSGDFGVLPGTVQLVDPSRSQTVHAVPGVVWTTVPGVTSFLTFTIPINLPPAGGNASPENWHVRITLDGEPSPCPSVMIKVARSVSTAACPTQVQINDGTVGGSGSPQSAGDVVSLIATAGAFAASGGTALFEAPTTVGGQSLPVGQPVPAQVVLWTAGMVQVQIPPSLPGFTQQAAWQLSVTPAGTTTACGPFTVHVAAAFPIPQALVLPPSPLVRGALVTVVPTQGSFLTTGAPGTVTLRRAGGTPAEWPVPGALWTSTSIVFTVPGNLPSPATEGAFDEAWEVHLQPAGAQPWGSAGTITVLEPTPALLGVPPVVVSEREIVLVATGATAGSQVNFYANGVRFSTRPNVSPDAVVPLPAPFTHLTGVASVVRVQAPTVTDVQRSEAYNTNQIRMPIEVELEDGDGDRSARMATQLLLPPPSAGFAWRSADTVTIEGIGTSHPELGEVGSNEWLGNEENGEVWIYPDGVSASDPAVPLMVGTTRLGQDYAHATREGASGAAVNEFQKVRGPAFGAVRPLSVTWREETVSFTLPAGTGSGRVVLFRDDLPSRAVPFPMDLCNPTFLSAQLRELFRVTLSRTRVGLAESLRIDLVRVPGVNNVLSDLISTRGVTTLFHYTLLRSGAAPDAGLLAGLPPAGQLEQGVPLTTRFVPELKEFVVQNGATPEQPVPWSLRVTAAIQNIPLTGDPSAPPGQVCPEVTVELPEIPFDVLGLPVPKLALGFDGKWFGPPAPLDEGAAIFLGDRGGGGFFWRSSNADVITILHTLVSSVRAVVTWLPGAIPNANGVDDVLVPAINELIRCGGKNQVDTYLEKSGNIANGLENDFSSFVLLGAGGTTFELSDGKDGGGTRARLSIPAGSWIADLATMHESWASRTNSPGPIPREGGFGDAAESYSW